MKDAVSTKSRKGLQHANADATTGLSSKPWRHPRLRLADLWPVREAGRIGPRGDNCHYTYLGRGAIHQLFSGLPARPGKVVLMPAFHCPTMVEPVLRAGHDVSFYDVTETLQLDQLEMERAVNDSVSAVVLVNYFGFETDLAPLEVIRGRAPFLLVEDCSHSFVRTNPTRLSGGRGDATVYSFAKTVACLVGGAWVEHGARLRGKPTNGPLPLRRRLTDIKEILDRIADATPANMIARLYRRLDGWRQRASGNAVTLRDAVGRADSSGGSAYEYDDLIARAKCPALVRYLVAVADLDWLTARRRENFQTYLARLPDVAGFRHLHRFLPDDVSPWSFPVLVEHRERIERLIEARGVPVTTFGETPHSLIKSSAVRFPVSARLSRQLLMLPVHQGIETAQVHRYCDIIREVLGETADNAQ